MSSSQKDIHPDNVDRKCRFTDVQGVSYIEYSKNEENSCTLHNFFLIHDVQCIVDPHCIVDCLGKNVYTSTCVFLSFQNQIVTLLYCRGFMKFLCSRSVGFFSRGFLVFLMKESKKRR